MTTHHPLIQKVKDDYKVGQRIELVSTNDPHTDLKPGAQGTVYSVDDAGTIHVCWDDKSHLGMVVLRAPGDEPDQVKMIDGESRFCDRCDPAGSWLS